MDFFLQILSTMIVAVSLLAAAGQIPLVKDWIGKWISSSIQAKFDKQLESLKSELRRDEDALKADMERVKSTVSAGLTAIAAQQSILNERRVKAIEALWNAKVACDGATMTIMIMGALDFNKAVREQRHDRGFQEFLKSIERTSPFEQSAKDKVFVDLQMQRPFLSAEIWAIYVAYMMIPAIASIKMKVLLGGLAEGGKEYFKEDGLQELVSAVAPECLSDMKANGRMADLRVMRVLDQKLIIACQNFLEGSHLGEMSVSESIRLHELASRAMATANGVNEMEVRDQIAKIS